VFVDTSPVPDLLAALAEHARRGEVRSRDLTKAYHGLARVGWPAGDARVCELLAALASRCVAIAGELDPMGVASVLWALSKLSQQAPTAADHGVVAALQGAAREMVPSLNPQDVAQILHAVATLCCADRGGSGNTGDGGSSGGSDASGSATPPIDSVLVSRLVERSIALQGAFKPQELSSVTAAAAQLGVPQAQLQALLARAAALAPRFDSASLASIAMATARHGVVCPDVLDAVGDAAAAGLGKSLSHCLSPSCRAHVAASKPPSDQCDG
jgi:hypothetical protein